MIKHWAPLLATLCIALGPSAGLAKPEFPADLDRRCAQAGRVPPNPSELARAAQPVLGDCALCHAFDLGLGQFPEGGNVTREGGAFPGNLDGFCALPVVNTPPTLAPIGSQRVEAGSTLSLLLMADDVDGDPLAFEIDPLPDGASFTDGGNAMAVFEWTPRADQVGSHRVAFMVGDGFDSALESIVIVVEDGITPPQANLPPVLSPVDDANVFVGERLQIAISATDPEGGKLSYGVAGLPTGAEFTDFGDGSALLAWMPDAAGTHRLTVTVVDDGVPPAAAEDAFAIQAVEAPVPGDLRLDDAAWQHKSRRKGGQLVVLGGGAAPSERVEILDDASGALLAARRADEFGDFKRSVRPFLAPCAVRARAGDVVSEAIPVRGAPADCGERVYTRVKKAEWKCEDRELRVHGDRGPSFGAIEIHDAESLELLAATQADRKGKFKVRAEVSEPPGELEIVLRSGDGEWRLGPVRVKQEDRDCRDEDDDEDDGDEEDDEHEDQDHEDHDDETGPTQPVN